MAIPAALLMRRFGYKVGLLTGLCVFALGTLLFWPAALTSRYVPFLVALFVVGAGSAILETAANPFVAQLGNPSTSEARLDFAQAFNPPGSITGVLLGTWFIFSGVEKSSAQIDLMKTTGTYIPYVHSDIMRVVPVYVGLGVVVLLLALLIGRMNFPTNLDTEVGRRTRSHARALLGYPHLLLAVLAQFCYVGAQVGTWSTFIPYLKAYTLITERGAGYLLTGTLVALACGRVCSTPLMRFISPARVMTVYAVINMALVFVGITRPGVVGGYALLATSFFMSVMFPTIFALGIKDLGLHTKLAGSLIVMSVAGGAVLPPMMGAVTRQTGSIAAGYWFPLAGYAVVALYGSLDTPLR
jgi:FHS family L-fucose permease-like MFS transporter